LGYHLGINKETVLRSMPFKLFSALILQELDIRSLRKQRSKESIINSIEKKR
jgi:hypothetical protein